MDFPFEVDDDEASLAGTAPGEALISGVLVVDDERVVLDVFSHLLAREDSVSVATAESAEGALELLRDRRFDLLITDKNLPGLGGVELIVQARRLRPAIEAIMITGYASGESVLAALAAGATDYLRKPFDDLKVVRAKIRAALGRRTERVQSRETAKRIAREATALLGQGKTVPDPIWAALERELALYEAAAREPAIGVVKVVGSPHVVARLREDGLDATLAGASDPALGSADVVVVDMAEASWRELAERLAPQSADVVLLARVDADVGDLLDALAMHMDLVGFGASREDAQGALGGKVQALLLRQTVERTQAALSRALDEFHQALKGA